MIIDCNAAPKFPRLRISTGTSEQDEDLFVRISKRAGISAYCGWAEDDGGFRISTNSSISPDFEASEFERIPLFGGGCR